jgi:hypothetical protein
VVKYINYLYFINSKIILNIGANHLNLAITLKNCGDGNRKLNLLKTAKKNYMEALEIYKT